MTAPDPILYSVWMRKGPDIEKYDLIFKEDGLVLRFLGEYWYTLRPRTGLQKRADLLIYSVRKKRARQKNQKNIYIDYCDIVRYELKKLSQTTSQGYIPPEPTKEITRLTLILRNGKRMEIEFSTKVYRLAKLLVKNYLIRGLEKCYNEHSRRR